MEKRPVWEIYEFPKPDELRKRFMRIRIKERLALHRYPVLVGISYPTLRKFINGGELGSTVGTYSRMVNFIEQREKELEL